METKERIRADYDAAEWKPLQTRLYHLGVNWTYRGFGMAMEAAMMVRRDESLGSCMKGVYIDVAKRNRTGRENVQRDIATLIRVIWEEGNRELLREMAGRVLADTV
ncbi:MAG: hypothetical protein HFI93_08270 [Lachnospiraceae bacterium]|nr:hypothetical protein [Lachnospiraceae bacterium]